MTERDFQMEILQRLTKIETQIKERFCADGERWGEMRDLIKITCPTHRRRTTVLERKMWVVWGLVIVLAGLVFEWVKRRI